MKEKIKVLNEKCGNSKYSFNRDFFDTIYHPEAKICKIDDKRFYFRLSMEAYHNDIKYTFYWDGRGGWMEIEDKYCKSYDMIKDNEGKIVFYPSSMSIHGWHKMLRETQYKEMQKICEEICGGEEKFNKMAKYVFEEN